MGSAFFIVSGYRFPTSGGWRAVGGQAPPVVLAVFFLSVLFVLAATTNPGFEFASSLVSKKSGKLHFVIPIPKERTYIPGMTHQRQHLIR